MHLLQIHVYVFAFNPKVTQIIPLFYAVMCLENSSELEVLSPRSLGAVVHDSRQPQ
jgi:hypothetical protein